MNKENATHWALSPVDLGSERILGIKCKCGHIHPAWYENVDQPKTDTNLSWCKECNGFKLLKKEDKFYLSNFNRCLCDTPRQHRASWGAAKI